MCWKRECSGLPQPLQSYLLACLDGRSSSRPQHQAACRHCEAFRSATRNQFLSRRQWLRATELSTTGAGYAGPHNVYFIWYGNWTGSSALTVLPDLIAGFGGSQYFNINSTYGDTTSNVANTRPWQDKCLTIIPAYSSNRHNVGQVISAPLNSGTLPVDSNGIYFVLTSPM